MHNWLKGDKEMKIYTPQEWSARHVEQPPELSAYDNAMEEYLKEVRIARGYTVREPSDYKDSQNLRWKQDALDWIAFRDQVMEYGLNVQNTFATTGVAPSLEEFRQGFPKITWSIQDESN